LDGITHACAPLINVFFASSFFSIRVAFGSGVLAGNAMTIESREMYCPFEDDPGWALLWYIHRRSEQQLSYIIS
jgi:hypothetical protein